MSTVVEMNDQKLNTIRSLYETSEEFRSAVDGALSIERDKAVQLADKLSAVVSNGNGEQTSPPAEESKTPPARRKAATRRLIKKPTHSEAISLVLKKSGSTGMTSNEILDAISELNIEGYQTPEKPVLFTTLHAMKEKGLIKAKGNRPNIHYYMNSK